MSLASHTPFTVLLLYTYKVMRFVHVHTLLNYSTAVDGYYRKATFLCMRNLYEFVKMGLWINLCNLYAFKCIVHSNVWRSTDLCNLHLTLIIHINKSHTEICRFTVFESGHYFFQCIRRCSFYSRAATNWEHVWSSEYGMPYETTTSWNCTQAFQSATLESCWQGLGIACIPTIGGRRAYQG